VKKRSQEINPRKPQGDFKQTHTLANHKLENALDTRTSRNEGLPAEMRRPDGVHNNFNIMSV
jgi:hypothetical protein